MHFDFVYQTPILTNWSYRAVHDQIMHTEHVRVAQLLYVLRALKVPERHIKSIKADAVILQNCSVKHRACIQGTAERTFEELPHLRTWTAGQAVPKDGRASRRQRKSLALFGW